MTIPWNCPATLIVPGEDNIHDTLRMCIDRADELDDRELATVMIIADELVTVRDEPPKKDLDPRDISWLAAQSRPD